MERIIHRSSNVLAGIACVCLVVLMFITFVDVVGRYFFNSPITSAVELIELGMGLTVFFGLAATTLKRAHIAVDMLVVALPKVLKSLFESLAGFIIVLVLGLMAWRLIDRANGFASDGLETSVLGLPVAPVVYCMAFAAAVAAIVALIQLLNPSLATKPNALEVGDLD